MDVKIIWWLMGMEVKTVSKYMYLYEQTNKQTRLHIKLWTQDCRVHSRHAS